MTLLCALDKARNLQGCHAFPSLGQVFEAAFTPVWGNLNPVESVMVAMIKGLVGASVGVVLLAACAAAPSLAGAAQNSEVSATRLLVQAYAALDKGRLQQAIRLYDRILRGKQKLPPAMLAQALLNRGLAHQRLGRLDAAIVDYDAALRIAALSPKARVRALYNRALAFRAKGEAGRAIEDLTAAIYTDPDFAEAYFARGNILHERGLYYLALSDYDQALAHGHPRKYQVHYARALLFSALNSLPRTKEALYAALREKPDYEPARKRLAAILKGRLPKARLFADLVRRPAKRILARISPAADNGVDPAGRTAAVAVIGAPVLNLRKTPQRVAMAPPAQPEDAAPRKKAPETQHLAGLKQEASLAAASARVAASTGRNTAKHARRKPTRVAAVRRQAPRVARRQPVEIRNAVITPASAPADEGVLTTQSITPPSGWSIQIASQRSEEAARRHWKQLAAKVKRTLPDGEAVIMRAELPGRGIFYRIRLVGYNDRNSAKRGCRLLKRRHIDCLVVRAGS